ncbi:mandelate racemase/muconate lactonizing enzyme family protein [Paenibacillus agricola]|uniref:Mandelate racemase/muconate lactonizing enzyme family protein n=1 Tax=Paenibacillus agricola TaxID=2716264 RepID=A0ABX0JAV9_9BACL|nr:mandelate racemase/muconate lactonizing enzyme family protein [Paenibacillus agricola]NHN32703.1 mandelate racemase/muconate lactonizing enzyme family protein [Paenibacillus agricola]
MKIKSIETFTTKNISMVRVKTDDGHEGYGQLATYNANISALVLHQQIAPYALGASAERIADLVEQVVYGEHKFPGSYICRAVGGLDTALWDLHGKRANKSVCELLGSKPRPVDVYGSSMRRNISPADEAERLKKMQAEQGFRAFKIRIGNNFGRDVDVYPGRTEQVVASVRQAIGNNTDLYVDANSGFSPRRAIEVGRMLEQQGVVHYEEPCPYPELEWTKQVTDALDVAVTGGEQDTDMAHWKRMISMHAVDIVQPDICYVGGLSRALEVAKLAQYAGMTCTPHAANRSMVAIFTLHMVSAIPNAGRFMELSIESDSWTESLFTTKLEVRNGQLQVPDGPGWGVSINPEWLDKADYQISQV